jgi:DnaJ-class molecular chaperone
LKSAIFNRMFSCMVNTLDGTDQIIIGAGTSSGSVVRLPRKGACKLGNKSYRGDHHVHIQVHKTICKINLTSRNNNYSKFRFISIFRTVN